jgi:hypothetical protein
MEFTCDFMKKIMSFILFTNFFFKIDNVKITNNHLIINQGGRL